MLSKWEFVLKKTLLSQCRMPFLHGRTCLKFAQFVDSCSPQIVKAVSLEVPNSFPESEIMYNHLLSNKKYRQTIAFLDYARETSDALSVETLLNSDLTKIKNNDFVDNLKHILHSHKKELQKFNEPNFIKFCEFLIVKIPELLDEQLLNLLKVLTLWTRDRDANNDLFYRMCKAIDDEALKRMRSWKRDKLLLTIDHFHRLGVLNFSSLMWNGMNKIFRRPQSLTSSQLVHGMLLMLLNRNRHPAIDFFMLECVLVDMIYELSAEEVAIIALGFFRSKKMITNLNLLNAMILKLEARMGNLDSVSLSALIKIIRYSVPNKMRLRLLTTLESFVDVVDDHSLTSCVRMVSLGTRHPIVHLPLLNKIFTRFVKEISSARLKEIERMLFAASLYDFNPNTDPIFFHRVIEELKIRKEEILKYPFPFICAVQFLCVKGIFDYDLLNEVLSQSFLTKVFKEISFYSIPCNIVEIDCCAKLDCPDYCGNTLDADFVNEFGSFYNRRSCAVKNKLVTKSEIIYMQTKLKLEELLGGPEFVHIAHILPYSNSPQLIFCLKVDKPVAISEDIRRRHNMNFQPVSKIGNWHAIQLWSTRAKIQNTGEPIGSLRSKQRHLRLLGYKCNLLKEDEWDSLNTDKVIYLKELIRGSA